MENRRFEFTAAEMDASISRAGEGAALAELDRMSQTLVVE